MDSARCRILVIDDEPFHWPLLQLVLPKADYEVDYCGEPTQALLLARDSQPDLILLDVMMPSMSGLDLCVLLKHNPTTAQIPVILVSGLDIPQPDEWIAQAEADGFIAKPFNPSQIARQIEQQYSSIKRLR